MLSSSSSKYLIVPLKTAPVTVRWKAEIFFCTALCSFSSRFSLSFRYCSKASELVGGDRVRVERALLRRSFNGENEGADDDDKVCVLASSLSDVAGVV